ncbi:hypothetical protein K5I29_02495 [Flavobacterium agricola]|uniref:Lipoprotein n=1 Tax=Flavobacterium agricola TaxID=2870839 RepID=A0ABY6M210_9FLAO|nr:hypothetical protein [Flavobacterium agricola]UYW01812.1 hypothetical protein K5I29_02495 [Flavobacterium agricola]
MMKSYLLLLCILIASCSSLRKSDIKKDIALEENFTEYRIKRVGDTVTYIVPNVILKDTVVYAYNKQGTTLKTTYDVSGKVTQVDCFASAFEEMLKRYDKLALDRSIEKTETEQNILKQFIPYFFCLLFLIIIILLTLIYFKTKR